MPDASLRRAAVDLLWERAGLAAHPDGEALARRRASLLERLRAAGAGDDPARLSTAELSPGCRNCLAGRGVALRLTTLCTRSCFFCFNGYERKDEPRIEARPARDLDALVSFARDHRLTGAGLSGGEPLMDLPRAAGAVRALRRAMGPRFYIHLYTNGDLADDAALLRLREAGLDGIRFDLAANGYDLEPVRRALERFDDVAVELPVIPGSLPRLKKLVRDLERLGAPYLNLHELCYSPANRDRFAERGFAAKDSPPPRFLTAMPVAGSEVEALELLLYAKKTAPRLSAFLCSWTTLETVINPAGQLWRAAARRGA